MSMASPIPKDPSASHLSQASLLGSPTTSGDGAPLFHEALERIADACIPKFEKLAGDDMSVVVTLASVVAESAGEVMAAVDPQAVTAFFDLPASGTRLLVTMEDAFLQLVIELMCGGMCSEPVPAAPRPGTSIDRQFARVVFNLLCTTLERECVSFGLGSMHFGQIETKIDPLAMGKRNTRVSVAAFTIECLGRRATVRIGFPQIAVDLFKREALPAAADGAAADPEWTQRFKAEIGRTAVHLVALLEAERLTLGDVATLKVGQILALPKAAPSRCELRCDDKLLFRCELGQADGRYSLRIDETLPRTPSPDAAATDPVPFFNLS